MTNGEQAEILWFLGNHTDRRNNKGGYWGERKGPAKRPTASSLTVFASTMVGFFIADKRFLACEDSRIPWKCRGKPRVNQLERNITVEWLYPEKRDLKPYWTLLALGGEDLAPEDLALAAVLGNCFEWGQKVQILIRWAPSHLGQECLKEHPAITSRDIVELGRA